MSQFKLLQPVATSVEKPSRKKIKIYSNLYSAEAVKNILKSITGPLAVDIETRGVQAADPTTEIVGVGISNGERNLYFHRDGMSDAAYQQLLNELSSTDLKLIAHNVFFDAAFLTRDNRAR